MAGPLRIKYAGASYHVIWRGNHCEAAFQSDSDYLLFTEKLEEYCSLYDVIVWLFK